MRLIRSSGETITPSDDAKLFEQVCEDGMFGEVTFTIINGLINMPAFKGIMCGRDFATDPMVLSPALPVGSSGTGYVLARIDLTQAAGSQFRITSVLAPYTPVTDAINDAGGTTYEMILAEYTATNSGVTAITMVCGKANPALSEKAHITTYAENSTGDGVYFGGGGTTIISGGEAAQAIVANDINSAAAGTNESVHIAADNTLYFYSNCGTIANRKEMKLTTGGNLEVPGAIKTGGLNLYPHKVSDVEINLKSASWSATQGGSGMYYCTVSASGFAQIYAVSICDWAVINNDVIIMPYIVSASQIGLMCSTNSFSSTNSKIKIRVVGRPS